MSCSDARRQDAAPGRCRQSSSARGKTPRSALAEPPPRARRASGRGDSRSLLRLERFWRHAALRFDEHAGVSLANELHVADAHLIAWRGAAGEQQRSHKEREPEEFWKHGAEVV